MSTEEISAQCDKLATAVTLIMDPGSSEPGRAEALQLCEEFMDLCPLCIPCALQLAKHVQPVMRHFGLKAIERFVRSQYSIRPVADRVYLKRRVLLLLTTGATSIWEEDAPVKDATARVVVELMKADWPVDWPELMEVLEGLCRKGETHAELVMRVLSRLAEDVIAFQTVTYNRHFAIKHAMKDHMRAIQDMVRGNLNYSGPKTEATQESQARSRRSLMVATLHALSGYIEWMAQVHITEKKCELLKTLWYLLGDGELRLEASQCLLVAINRLWTPVAEVPLMALFEDVVVQHLFSPAETSHGEGLTDQCYLFLTRQCQLLCAVGEQLCHTVDLHPHLVLPSIFEKYLDSLLCFTTHSSQFVSAITQSTWQAFFNQEVLSHNPFLLAMLPKYVRATRTNLVKVGFPSKNDSPSCAYARLDFLNDTDFYEFLTAYRDEQKKLIEVACRLDHGTCFQIASECLKSQLSAVVDPGPKKPGTTDGLSSTSPNSFLQWEAMTVFVNVVISNLFKVLSKEEIPVKDGLELLQLIIHFKTKDPLILACVPIHITTFLPFLDLQNECLPPGLLSRLIEIIEEIKAPKAHAFKNARRGACSCILKICRENGQFILPDFEMLYHQVELVLCNEQLLLTQIEKNTLMEAMIIVMNQYKDCDRQKAFLEKLIAPILLSNKMRRMLFKTKAFIQHDSANVQITETVKESSTDLNRSRIINFVSTILGVMRWTSCPTDLEEAMAGGFVIGFMPNGKPIYCNPCTEQVLNVFKDILVLIRILQNIDLPNVASKMEDQFAKALDQLEVKNTSILHHTQPLIDTYDPSGNKTDLERMQGYFCTLYETCFSILGHAATTMKQDFYTIKDLVDQLLKSAFGNLRNIPSYRLLIMLRCFLKPLVRDCPSEYSETILSPILGVFLTSLAKTLSCEWKIIDKRNMENETSTAVENPESLKILEKQLKLLTGEVMEFITACLLSVNADTSVLAAKPVETNIGDASHKNRGDGCVSNKDADNTIYTAESDDEGWASVEDANTSVTSESDNCCEPIEDANTIAVGAVSDVACSRSKDDADTRVTSESDTCCEPIEYTNTIAVGAAFDVACNQSKDHAYNSILTTESDDDSCLPIGDAETSVDVAAEPDGPPHLNDPTMSGESSVKNILLNACSQSNMDAAVVLNSYHQKSGASRLLLQATRGGNMEVEKLPPLPASTNLTKLGMGLMQEKDVCAALLVTAFSSLVWTDSFTCYQNPSHLCRLLLDQVTLEPPSETVSTLCFTMVLKELHKHKDNESIINILLNLAFQIYESLRPCCIRLGTVMRQLSSCGKASLKSFDQALLAPACERPDINSMKHRFRYLLKGCIEKPLVLKFQDSCAPSLRKRKTIRCTSPPSKKKLLPTMYWPFMSPKEDHFSEDGPFPLNPGFF